jgi:hypothetical protein
VTASRVSPFAAALALLLLGAPGCRSPAGAPPRTAFHPPARAAAIPPNVADRTAVDIARAALTSDRQETDEALQRLQAIETVLKASDEPSTGLLPVSLDLRNTLLDDRRAYRRETRRLLARRDLDPELRARLELFRDDDPLELAEDRIHDAWLLDFARAFNALAEPIGRSIMTAQLAPYRLGFSLVNYAVAVYTQEALTLQRRQALAHWKEFLARNPESAESQTLTRRVQQAQGRYNRTQRDRAVRVAKKALELGKVRLALIYADRALRFVPEDQQASKLREEAGRRLIEIRDKQRRSVGFADQLEPDARSDAARGLALALLTPGGDVASAARRLRATDPDGSLADEARYAEALALGEAGRVDDMWSELEALAHEDPEASNMARHAAALVSNPSINTWGAFSQARGRARWDRFRWVFFGRYFAGVPDRGLPGPMEWIVGAPSVAEAVIATPMRLINVPWARALPSTRVTAALARGHLERDPHGTHSLEVRDWLGSYERKRGNWIAALALAAEDSDADLMEIAELREKAAAQYLEIAARESSRSARMGMYQQLGLTYPGSRAARVAAEMARDEMEEATAQHVRISRAYLQENPELAGPEGLGLRPELLDGRADNAELHADGVTLIGSNGVEVSYLAASGEEEDPPRRVREGLEEEHLARVVSLLEETSYHNMLLDPEDFVKPDARRDLYFERARLGLTARPDRRPDAGSYYAYRGMRERYGLVRSRESILPFDLVLQGSLSSLSLGAFPRIRPPRETPDSILYR